MSNIKSNVQKRKHFHRIKYFLFSTGVGSWDKVIQKFGWQLWHERAPLRNQLVLAGSAVERQIPFQGRLQPEHHRHTGLELEPTCFNHIFITQLVGPLVQMVHCLNFL